MPLEMASGIPREMPPELPAEVPAVIALDTSADVPPEIATGMSRGVSPEVPPEVPPAPLPGTPLQSALPGDDPASGFLGILMLDTRFPRPLGDVGNADTWRRAGIPVRFVTVTGASPERIVKEAEADLALLQPFIDAAIGLERAGAVALSTSCGFLAAWQARLQQAVAVPVVSSSLLQAARFERPGIVTIAAAALSPAVLRGAGVPEGTPVQGVAPGCEFHRRILSNDATLDLRQAEQDVVAAALRLVEAHPEVTDIVLECTNMPPYRQAVALATGRAVHDIETLLISEWAAWRKPCDPS
jgi:uncharacterized protein YlxP (DUF503 family)